MKARDIKTKRVWKRVRPLGIYHNQDFLLLKSPVNTKDNLTFMTVTQADFLREFYPSGHAINDPTTPDIYKEERIPVYDDNGDKIGEKSQI